jgi:hypothetical protein
MALGIEDKNGVVSYAVYQETKKLGLNDSVADVNRVH